MHRLIIIGEAYVAFWTVLIAMSNFSARRAARRRRPVLWLLKEDEHA